MPNSTVTIEEAFRSYVNVYPDLNEQTVAHTKRALDLLMEYLKTEHHSFHVAEIGTDEAYGWRAWLIHEKDPEGHPRFKPSTVNSYIRSAAPLFRWLTQRKSPVIPANPFRQIKYVEETIPVLVYTKDEIYALLDAADLRWKGMITIACSAGLGRGEVLNLTWADIDCTANRVTVQAKQDDLNAGTWAWKMKRRGKDRRPVVLPVSSNIGGILVELQASLNINQPYPFIWPPRYFDLRSRIGSLPATVRNCPDSNFNRDFKVLCREAGVEKGDRDFHDLRKTFVTNLIHIPGLSMEDVRALARHADIKTTMRYMAVNSAAAGIAQEHSLV